MPSVDADDTEREVCLVDVDHGDATCEAVIQCFAHVLSLVPVTIQDCPPVLV